MSSEKGASRARSSHFGMPALSGLLILVILVLVGAGLFIGRRGGLKEGDPVPSFKAPFYDGGEFAFPDAQGRPVVVHFWASWCVECYKEIAMWVEMWDEYKDRGVVFLGVNYKDPEGKAREFIQTYGIRFPCAKDPRGKLAGIFGVTGVPESYFITSDGRLAHKVIGPIKEDYLRRWLEELVQ